MKLGSSLKLLAPGILLTLVVALATRFIHGFLPETLGRALGEVVIGMAVGLIIGNAVSLPAWSEAGIRFCFGFILRLAIVLLGARISLQAIADIGGSVLLLIIGLVILAVTAARLMCAAAGVPPKLGALIGVGTAICGNTAISVTAPIIHARDEEVSFAIAVNTLFGTFAVFFYPLFSQWLGLSPEFFGIWAGVAVNDTSQVIAAGYAYGDQAGDIALTVKLTRNALLGFVLIAVGLIYAKEQTGEEPGLVGKIKNSVPDFVIGFLIMAVLNTFGFFESASDTLGRDIQADLKWAAKLLILIALCAVGLNTHFGKLRAIGLKPFLIGLAVALLTAVTSWCVIRFLII